MTGLGGRGPDLVSGQPKLEPELKRIISEGVPGGGVIFSGDEDGYLMAFDAQSGKNLWKVNVGAAIKSSPITYLVDGRQYVTVPAGAALLTFSLPQVN